MNRQRVLTVVLGSALAVFAARIMRSRNRRRKWMNMMSSVVRTVRRNLFMSGTISRIMAKQMFRRLQLAR